MIDPTDSNSDALEVLAHATLRRTKSRLHCSKQRPGASLWEETTMGPGLPFLHNGAIRSSCVTLSQHDRIPLNTYKMQAHPVVAPIMQP